MATTKMRSTVEIGIDAPHRQKIADQLNILLADTYCLYLKTQNYHWNVTGPQFQSLHAMFQLQYEALTMAIDEIAERIRTLGFPAPGSFAAFTRLTRITEADKPLDAEAMVCDLIEGHETIVRGIRELFPMASDAHDEVTVALLGERLTAHEKTAWMLRSSL